MTVADIARVGASAEQVRVTSMARALAARAYADVSAERRPIYGRSTGVGGKRLVPLEDPWVLAVIATPTDWVLFCG